MRSSWGWVRQTLQEGVFQPRAGRWGGTAWPGGGTWLALLEGQREAHVAGTQHDAFDKLHVCLPSGRRGFLIPASQMGKWWSGKGKFLKQRLPTVSGGWGCSLRAGELRLHCVTGREDLYLSSGVGPWGRGLPESMFPRGEYRPWTRGCHVSPRTVTRLSPLPSAGFPARCCCAMD